MSDAHGVARDQLRAFIERIERLEEEKKTIADDIKDVYGEAKAMGYDTKIMKQVIALRKKDDHERTEEELIRDTYLAALGMIPDFEAAPVAPKQKNKPAMALQSPRKAAEAVSERTAFTDAPIAPVLVEADKAEAVAGGLGQPETIPALTGQFPGVNVGGPERAGVTAGETATNSPETAASSTAARKDVPSETSEDGRHLVGNENCQDKREEASHRQAGNQDLPVDTNFPIAPASQGEAESPSAERVSPQAHEATTGSAGANTGGSHVTGSALRAGHPDPTSNNGEGERELIKALPGKPYNLRPNCLKPQNCAGHGSRHCHACTVAARESEAV